MENKEKAIANDYLRSIVMNLPETPGIYQYLDSEGTIIYVGKAKNLKRRVYSYLPKSTSRVRPGYWLPALQISATL